MFETQTCPTHRPQGRVGRPGLGCSGHHHHRTPAPVISIRHQPSPDPIRTGHARQTARGLTLSRWERYGRLHRSICSAVRPNGMFRCCYAGSGCFILAQVDRFLAERTIISVTLDPSSLGSASYGVYAWTDVAMRSGRIGSVMRSFHDEKHRNLRLEANVERKLLRRSSSALVITSAKRVLEKGASWSNLGVPLPNTALFLCVREIKS